MRQNVNQSENLKTGHLSPTCGWSAASRIRIRHCADAMGAPTLLLICGTKLKATAEGEALDWLGPPVMVALAGVLLM